MNPVRLQNINNVKVYNEVSTEFQDISDGAEVKWSLTG
jgi:hypothetical protein